MVMGWLKGKADIAAIKGAAEDMERFNMSLRGCSDEEVGTTVALATFRRFDLQAADLLPRQAIDFSIPRDEYACDMTQMKLHYVIRDLQKWGRPAEATGVMVWLYTVRAFNMPEVRVLGREMWAQLVRGFPFAAEKAETLAELTGARLPNDIAEKLGFVPPGLEPA